MKNRFEVGDFIRYKDGESPLGPVLAVVKKNNGTEVYYAIEDPESDCDFEFYANEIKDHYKLIGKPIAGAKKIAWQEQGTVRKSKSSTEDELSVKELIIKAEIGI